MTSLQPPRTPPGMKTADFANEQAYQAYLNALFHLINVVIRIRGRHFKKLMWSKFQSDHIRILFMKGIKIAATSIGIWKHAGKVRNDIFFYFPGHFVAEKMEI